METNNNNLRHCNKGRTFTLLICIMLWWPSRFTRIIKYDPGVQAAGDPESTVPDVGCREFNTDIEVTASKLKGQQV